MAADVAELESARVTQVEKHPGEVDEVAHGLFVRFTEQPEVIELEGGLVEMLRHLCSAPDEILFSLVKNLLDPLSSEFF